MAKKSKTNYRSAVTGKYITKKDADKNPRESVKETDKRKK